MESSQSNSQEIQSKSLTDKIKQFFSSCSIQGLATEMVEKIKGFFPSVAGFKMNCPRCSQTSLCWSWTGRREATPDLPGFKSATPPKKMKVPTSFMLKTQLELVSAAPAALSPATSSSTPRFLTGAPSQLQMSDKKKSTHLKELKGSYSQLSPSSIATIAEKTVTPSSLLPSQSRWWPIWFQNFPPTVKSKGKEKVRKLKASTLSVYHVHFVRSPATVSTIRQGRRRLTSESLWCCTTNEK